MKTAGFFLAVFCSMLAVFLLATGEVKRWFSKEARPAMELVTSTVQGAPGSPVKNMLEFDFYDVERAELKFTIRAEFSQDEFQVDTPIEEISRVTLRNGVIEVPMQGDGAPSSSPEKGKEKGDDVQQKLILEFKSALYQRGSGNSDGKSGLEILLRDGKGTTEDGAEFFFEELSFDEKAPSTFVLRSQKPVSIRSPSFGVMSRVGFEGTLKERGQQEFSLFPPVAALLDPRALGTLSGEPEIPPAGEAPGPRKAGQKIAVTCQGPLSIVCDERDRSATARKPSKTIISFSKDVVVYAVDAATKLDGIPLASTALPGDPALRPLPENDARAADLRARASRFECQNLEIELENASGKPSPRRAVATWEGGRVKAYVQREAGGEVYTIDGDRLEWCLEGREGSNAPASWTSEAVLQGKPTLRGKGMLFQAERALFHPMDNRIVLQTVHGSMEYLPADEKDARKTRKQTETKLPPPEVGAWDAGGENRPPKLAGNDPRGEEGPSHPRRPQQWDLSADEAEFFFTDSSGEAGDSSDALKFSKFVARSKNPDGVQIKSHDEAFFQATGSFLTYSDPERKAILEGTKDIKPRFTQGENWLDARRILFFQEESAVWFEEEVRARVEDWNSLRFGSAKVPSQPLAGKETRKGSIGEFPVVSPPPATELPAEPPGDARQSEAPALDMEADFLAVRFHEQQRTLRDIVAKGLPNSPVRASTLSTPWYRFSGPEFYWDQDRDLAQLASTGRNTAPTPGSQDASDLARVEVEGGELLAERILFHRGTWRAQLTNHVTLRAFQKEGGSTAPLIEVNTGKAEVEFFENLAPDKLQRTGPFRNLARLKSFHAVRSPDGLIAARGEARGVPFAARAEECAWDCEARQLRFYGTGEQEIELLGETFHGPIRSREIIYDEAKNLVTLSGVVRGRLVQSLASEPAARAPSPVASPKEAEAVAAQAQPAAAAFSGRTSKLSQHTKGPLIWELEANTLEIQLRQEAEKASSRFESLRARDKVDLRNADLGLQLRGDDLFYDPATQKVHVFSPDGRPQTLVYSGVRTQAKTGPGLDALPPAENKEDPAADRANKIVSQEIWLLWYTNPHAVLQRGDRTEWFLAQFEKDVIATLYVETVDGAAKRKMGTGDLWKMVADKLTLYVDPIHSGNGPGNGTEEQSFRRVVPWAAASGKVAFTTGTLQATADRAIYEDSRSRVTLYGSPARLYKDNKPAFAEPEIVILKEGNTTGATYGRGDGKLPRVPGLEPPR